MKAWTLDEQLFVLELTDDEAAMLARLIEQMQHVFDAVRDGTADRADPVIERLFPDAYVDEEQAEEFRRLTSVDAAGVRLERQRAMAIDLDAMIPLGSDRVRVEVPEDSVQAWLLGLGDIRLVLHTRVERGPAAHVDLSADDLAQFQAVVDWLGFAQGSLVDAVRRRTISDRA